MEREEFIKKWLEGKLSAEELEKELKNSDELAELKDIVETSSKLKVPQKKSKEDAWAALSEKIKEEKSPKVVKFKPWIPMSIAASVIVFVVSYFIFFNKEYIVAQRGEHLSYTLPDGSKVWLNADSKISFKDFTIKDKRRINLEGEAYFDIKPGGEFTVVCKTGSVSVIGTSFNVFNRNEDFNISCFSGRVKVMFDGSYPVVLNGGQSTELINRKLADPGLLNPQTDGSWRNGEFYFEHSDLSEVIEELERQFNIDIEYSGNINRTYTGYFHNKDVDEALQLVFAPMGLTFEKKENKVIVR